MKRQIIKTKDGSNTIHLPEWNENYHSHHGAIQEAMHVFIGAGLNYLKSKDRKSISVLEIGFGTGLNAVLSLDFALKNELLVRYTGIEAYPISEFEHQLLKYEEQYDQLGINSKYQMIFDAQWEKTVQIDDNYSLTKKEVSIHGCQVHDESFDCVFFDAFGPRVQPEMWTKEVFELLYKALKKEGVLVTYCAKGDVRRTLISVGFEVEKLPGPPGKREMLRAVKN